MTAFCVFGISKSLCKKSAEKKQETFEMVEQDGRRVRRNLTIQEWAVKRDALAESMFSDIDRRTQINPKFDSPKFARDWIDSAPTEVRDCVIMVRGQKIDKSGGAVIKDGAPVMTWIEYEANKVTDFGPLKFQAESPEVIAP